MTQDDARRSLEASTDFEIHSGRVWLRQVRWLRAAAELSAGGAIQAGAIEAGVFQPGAMTAAGMPRPVFTPPAGRSRRQMAEGGWSGDRLS